MISPSAFSALAARFFEDFLLDAFFFVVLLLAAALDGRFFFSAPEAPRTCVLDDHAGFSSTTQALRLPLRHR